LPRRKDDLRPAGRAPSKPLAPTDLWERMAAIREKVVISVRPVGYFTTREYADKFGLSRNKAITELENLHDAGLVEVLKAKFFIYWKFTEKALDTKLPGKYRFERVRSK